MVEQQTVERIDVDGQPAWAKRYGNELRRFRLALLDAAVRLLGVPALRPPPRHAGDDARATEQRRILQLAGADVVVPGVLHSGEATLVLADIGRTLAAHLREVDAAGAERLFADAAEAIACVHAAGQYLGQPLPRNITIDAIGRIGFLDFEEDPGEVMDLRHAQARDWLVFTSGVAKYLPLDEQRMGKIIADAMASVPAVTRDEVARSVARLGFLETLTRPLGRRAASLGKAVAALRAALRTALTPRA
ncbi:serine/threonine protein phosphatase [Alkalisalibacterium limincola]|uniref:Serine/threonine protein phosphatase n=1 Tax=Alkalisalibacterium limincola TaxID=2699169 RepID=A0A5C8KXB0_9GAMM|nr:serine/threonine protein phosphatase [Alkalisalibacterium limincola]TXK65880.1 serine/threonine protein phosphatase [Alkalisalibacterium limincola]